ncbi:hypothetical protein AS4_24870 [Acinetobacter guillouiae]|nr:hypothetical protein AS4_24870 [Acinetobacter guillouiae]
MNNPSFGNHHLKLLFLDSMDALYFYNIDQSSQVLSILLKGCVNWGKFND